MSSSLPLFNGDAGPIIATEAVEVITTVQVQLKFSIENGSYHIPNTVAQWIINGDQLCCGMNACI